VHGRGTCDMKGGVAAALGAVAAVRRAGVTLREPVAVHTVVGEEDGGIGAFATLGRGHGGGACVIAEPTSAAVVPANAGSLTFRLDVPGLATHGSTRTLGVSAVSTFEVVHQALRHLEEMRNRAVDGLFAHLDLAWPLSVGIVRSGDWASTVPDRLVAEGRYGVRIDESVAEAKAAFEEAVTEACARDSWLRTHRVVVSWPGGEFAPARLPDGDPLLDDVLVAAEDAGAPARPRVEGGPYGYDLRHYVGAGIPTVQYGPGEARLAHSAEEYVGIEDVMHCARAYTLLVLRRCGVA
jgi:acetylornithine deacetylase